MPPTKKRRSTRKSSRKWEKPMGSSVTRKRGPDTTMDMTLKTLTEARDTHLKSTRTWCSGPSLEAWVVWEAWVEAAVLSSILAEPVVLLVDSPFNSAKTDMLPLWKDTLFDICSCSFLLLSNCTITRILVCTHLNILRPWKLFGLGLKIAVVYFFKTLHHL